MAMASHDKKSDVAPHFNCLDLTSVIVPFMIPSVWCESTLVPMALHDPKKSFVPHFSYLDLTDVVVVFKLPLALHDADAGVTGIT